MVSMSRPSVAFFPDEKALMVAFFISISQMGFRGLPFKVSETIWTFNTAKIQKDEWYFHFSGMRRMHGERRCDENGQNVDTCQAKSRIRGIPLLLETG